MTFYPARAKMVADHSSEELKKTVSKWPGKYVIGLTGNIATGKSVVRKMLEHLGAYGIDADALGHRAISKGAPGYQQVIEMFGKWIVDPDGQINRSRLGRIVFTDPEALERLEAIVHPMVLQAVDLIVQRSTQAIIVIEAIKLLESNLHLSCDSVWVSVATPQHQINRLVHGRGLSENDARQRVQVQSPQERKIASANIVIKNNGTYTETWRQVTAAWQKVVPVAAEPAPAQPAVAPRGEWTVERGRPRHSGEIAGFITRIARDRHHTTTDDIMAAFGEKAFLLLQLDRKLVGVVGWQVENLVARTTDVYLDPNVPTINAMPTLMSEMERASRDLQCEASLLFLPAHLAQTEAVWKQLGYDRRAPETLSVQAWQEAAKESYVPGTVLFFKQLRQDRILRPI